MRGRAGAAGVLAAGTALLAVGLTACRRPPVVTAIRVAHEADAISLDPIAVQEAATHSILSNIYEPLVRFDRDLRLVPALATSWNAVDDRTWVFALRPGVRFHDGLALTAAHVKDSLERARRDPASGVTGLLSTVQEIEAVNDHTLTLRTTRPDPIIIVRLTYVLVARGFGPDERSSRPLGTGPYKINRWDKGRALEAEAFPAYWGGRPAIDRVTFVPVELERASVQELRAQRVDVLRWVPETLASQVASEPGVKLRARAGLTSYYVWMSATPVKGARNPFSDRRVRQAISLAIDRAGIIARLGGHGVVATQLVQKGIFGHLASLPALAYDPERARRALTEAGYPDGFETTLVHRRQASVGAVAQMLREMLARIGVQIRLETPDWPAVVERWTQGRLPFFLAGWRFESGDAATFLRDCLYTRDRTLGTGSSNPGFSSRQLDRLIDENDQIFGEASRLRQYEQIMRLAMEEMPIIPLYHRLNLYAVADRVVWEPRLDGKLVVSEMSLAPGQ